MQAVGDIVEGRSGIGVILEPSRGDEFCLVRPTRPACPDGRWDEHSGEQGV